MNLTEHAAYIFAGGVATTAAHFVRAALAARRGNR